MPSFGVALAWMIISPCAFLTDCWAIICIFHYKPLYHSCDVAFISIFVTMATNAWLLLPIPAVVKMADLYWSQSLCAFYTWLSITLRSSHILVLLVLNVYWMASIRVSSRNKLFTSAKPITVSVFICWFISLIIGLIPAVDVAHLFDYYEDNVCKFLPSNISREFAIFFIIVPLVSTVMGVVSSLDSLLLFKAMKEEALTKYSADRFHLPTISGGIRTSALIHAKYNELNVTIELCRLVLVFSMMSSVLNAIPLLASQFVQQIQNYSRETLESTLLWLLLLEALILPHVLWLMSRRYRHAVAYTWRVFVLRDTSAREEDTASCSLQAFRINVKDVTSRPYRNGGVNTTQMNGTVSGPGIEDHHEEITRNGDYNTPRPRSNGFLHAEPASRHDISGLEYSLTSAGVSTASATELTTSNRKAQAEVVVLHETIHQEMTYAQKKTFSYNDVHETSLTSGQYNEGNTSTPKHSIGAVSKSSSGNSGNSAQLPSPTKSPTKSAGTGHVKRSVSGSSRMEWKERMMKKHLPSVFLNTSVEDETDTNPTSSSKTHTENTTLKDSRISGDNAIPSRRQEVMSRVSADWTSTESTYYLSGDYHYDYLNDTLGRSHPRATVEVDESAGKYADEDIKNILDTSLTSENCVNGVDICDSDNYLLKSINVGQYESNPELLDNGKYAIRTIKDITLPSDEIHPRDTEKSVNSHNKYAEYTSNNITNVKVPYNDQFRDTTTSLSNDRTALGGSNIPESLCKSTATIVSVSTGQPSIRRSNYRKFLPYTDLIISDVDDVTADGNVEQDERHKHGEVKEPTAKSELAVEGHNSPSKETIAEKEIKASSLSKHLRNLQNPETRDQFVTGVNENHDDDDDDYVQDYSKCETVSGSEMLRLKMKSIRSASALYLSDDTTSDDGGVDNNGFIETSNDDSDDDNNDDKYYEKQNTQLFNNSRSNNTMKGNIDGIVSRSEDVNKFRPKDEDENDDDEFVEIRLGRNWVGDGQESNGDVANYAKAALANYQVVKQGADNPKEKYVARNDNQEVKSNDRVEPTPSSRFKNTDDLPVSGHARITPQILGDRGLGASEGDSNTHLTDSANGYISSESTGPTGVTDLHIPPAGDSTHVAKQPGFITKPPRHRKHPDESQLMAGDSYKGSIHGTAVEFGDRAITTIKNRPYTGTINNGMPVQEDMAFESDISEVTDTDSTGSELSVTLEPYGERRLDWMNDVLLDSSSYEQTMYKRAREFPSLEEASTNFMSNYNGDVSNLTTDANLKRPANHEKVGISYNGIRLPDILPHQPHHPLLIPYHFNDHTDEDDENNSIMIDYSAQSNFYRHKNLYFEAIKEEPEDLLSDSASSFDQSENSITNVLRDQPITSNGKLGSNVAGNSISPISINTPHSVKHPQFQQNKPIISRDDIKFPTTERTSADGSEEIPPTHSSNCLSNSQTHTSIKTDVKHKPHAMQQTTSGKDPANQTTSSETTQTFQSIKHTKMQNLHSPSTTVTDTVHSSQTPMFSKVHKHDLLTTTDYRVGNNGHDQDVRNSGPVDFYSEVQFPKAMEADSRNGEVNDATPVYF